VNTGDRSLEYQALEGRSSVAYQQKKYDRSSEYLTAALTAVSSDSVVNSAAARERIISKIKGIVKIQLQQDHQQPLICEPQVVCVIKCDLNVHFLHNVCTAPIKVIFSLETLKLFDLPHQILP